MAVPSAYVDATGCHIPSYADILSGLQDAYRGIYGEDVVLTADTQDGQLLALFALAIYDSNTFGASVYNAFSPATAQGTGLSSVVKVNGIARETASYSTCDLTIVGQAGSIITNGVAGDENGYAWSLPTPFTIPLEGQIVVTGTCLTLGAITAAAGTIDKIKTPQRGWQSVTNVGPATAGAPVESDAQLRVRQAQSTMLPSQAPLDGVRGAIASIPGVTRLQVYENDTSVTDVNGIPGHAISVVVDGGDALAICQAIAVRKLGVGTYGSASQVVTNSSGTPREIRFFRPIEPPITFNIVVKALTGYTTDTETAIKQAVSDWVNALGIGSDVLLTRVYGPALLAGTPASNLFEIISIVMGRDNAVPQAADIPMAFNEAAFCLPDYVNIGYVS